MKSVKLLVAVLLLLFGASSVFAQNIKVSGTVKDSATGETVPFAFVQIKGTQQGYFN